MALKGVIYSKIAGVSHKNPDGEPRQEIIQKYCRAGMPLILVPEPDNPYSDTAVGIWANTSQGRKQLGYIRDTDLDDDLFELLQSGGKADCQISEVTGGGDKTLGVNIRIQIIENVPTPKIAGSVKPGETKDPLMDVVGKAWNSGRKGKIIIVSIAAVLVIFCCLVYVLRPTAPETASVDLNAIGTAAVQSAWAPITQTAQAWTTTPASTATSSATYTPLPTYTPQPTATQTLTAAQRIIQYSQIDPRELVTYPKNHTGEMVAVWGKVFNINGDQELQIWIAGSYDAVYVQMSEPFVGLYKDDVISVYGTVAGENCGANAYGAEVCQPLLVDAFYVKQQ